MIPETRGKKIKYDFSSMIQGSYVVMKSFKEGVSIRSSAFNRGYRIAIRTIDGEVRAYFVGRMKK